MWLSPVGTESVLAILFTFWWWNLQRQITGGGQLSVETLCENSMQETIGALVANAALLIVTATSFYNAGLVVITLQDAHALMEQVTHLKEAPQSWCFVEEVTVDR
jgi:hypothetical protein